jgi:hypothetical protein
LDNINKVILASKEKNQNKAIDLKVLENMLLRLKKSLDIFELSAINQTVKALQEFTQAEGIGHSVENILEKILVGEYNEALSAIDNLINSMNQNEE